MLQITVKIKGIDYKLPDPQNEKKIPRLKQIEKDIKAKFEPVFKAYPDAKVFVLVDGDKPNLAVKYISTNYTIQEIAAILHQSGGIQSNLN